MKNFSEEESKVFESELLKLGYKKHNQAFKSSAFQYWKECGNYQVGVLFYDFSKYKVLNTPPYISVQYEAMIINNDFRVDMSVSKDITPQQFEKMAEKFYNCMK